MHTDKCLIKYVYLQAEKTQRAPLLEYSNIQIGVPARGYLRARKHIRNEVFCIDRCVLWPEHPLFYISECFHPTLHFKMSEIIFASLYHLCQFIISFLNLQLAVRAGIINFCQARARSARARRACALRALGLLLADGTPTVGGGKTF